MPQLPRFYRDDPHWHALAEQLKLTPCPHCAAVGALIRHGHLYGYDQRHARHKPQRGHRIFCSNRRRRPGCGRTFSVWRADNIRRLSLTADAVWRFLQNAVAGTLAAASRAVADCRRSDRTWQRLWQRFRLGQCRLRTALAPLCPPPHLPAVRRPAAHVGAHLHAAFPAADCPIAAETILRAFQGHALRIEQRSYGRVVHTIQLTVRQRQILQRLGFPTPTQLLSARLPHAPP